MDALKATVARLGDSVNFYKVGMELFYAAGEQTVMYLKEQNKNVFLDLKLHDIPNTVAHGVSSLTRLGVNLITLHGQGGKVMMEAAVQAAHETAARLGVKRPKLLAVTVLTSFDDENWQAIGGQLPIADQVIRLAKLAKEAGMDGVVATNTTISREAVKGMPHASEMGGLSGAPVLESSNQVIRQLRSALGSRFPIIGVGGIMSAEDALSKIRAGADVVQIYTGLIYEGPALVEHAAKAIKASRIKR